MKSIKIIYSVWVLLIFAFLNDSISQSVSGLSDQVTLRGRIDLGAFVFNTNRAQNFRGNQGYSMNASLHGNIYGVSIPVSFSINEQGSFFSQSFNRFCISPNYKSLTLHIGYKNHNWSEFILSGATIKGVGIDFKPSEFNIQAIKGSLLQAQLADQNTFGVSQFERNVTAFRLGYEEQGGNEIHFMYLKGEDDISSLPSLTEIQSDSIPAQKNNCFGVTARMPVVNDHLFATFDGALSIFTENTRFPYINFAEYDDFSQLDGKVSANVSTHVTTAINTGLNYQNNTFQISGTYRKVRPRFKSFGANYILSDIESLTINPRVNLLNRRLILSASYGVQYNNLDGRLIKKTNRQIGAANVSYNPNLNFGINARYSNFSINQQIIKDSLANDSIIIDQINQNISVTPRFSFFTSSHIHNLIINVNAQKLDAPNQNTELSLDNTLFNINVNYGLSFIQSQFNFNLGYNYLNFNSDLASSKQNGLVFSISKKLINNKLLLFASTNYSKLNTNATENNLINFNGRIVYTLSEKSSISLNSFIINNRSVVNPINEQRIQIRYRWKF